MSKKVLIVDDEEDARELLKVHLRRHHQLTCIGEAKNGEEAIPLIDSLAPDIVLLDIQMPEMNGIEVVERLNDMQPYIIFITAYDQFAVKAFELNAVDYLLKPFSKERFDTTIEKVLTASHERDYQDMIATLSQTWPQKTFLKRFSYRSGLKTSYIPVEDVIMIESADQYIQVHAISGKYLIRLAMDYLQNILDPAMFYRTHRSFFVNLNFVESVEQYETRNFLIHLHSSRQAKLSREKKESFNKFLIGDF